MTNVITPSTDNAVLEPISKELLFKGRSGDLRLGEWVLLEPIPNKSPSKNLTQVFLFGCPDDTGVRLNRGRPGAEAGPQEIRRAFYKMALPMDNSWASLHLYDCGNVAVSNDIEETHQNAFQAAQDLASHKGTVILLGGGHDFAAPGFLGFASGRLRLNKSESFGLINIDPHLDVRELEEGKPHSGTPFRQILDSKVVQGKNFIEFGCRENRNSHNHLRYCEEKGVIIEPLERLRRKPEGILKSFRTCLDALSKRVDTLGITLDLDSCAEILGTSAAPAIGFSLRELYDMAYLAGTYPQINYFELAEVAPKLDPSGKTALGAAEILYAFLCGKSRGGQLNLQSGAKKKTDKTLKNIKKRRK